MNRQKLDPAWLPPGTVVGPWKLKGFHSAGAFGVVFRAVRARREHGGLVALKFALRPGDPRFQREAELQGRIHHPSVPEALGAGEWEREEGVSYPYLAMEWVEGLPLYEWAERYRPSSRQVCRVLAQVARGLEATHAMGGVHRDVKGANVLVDPERLRAWLTDFGACNYQGAQRLTSEGLPPGTKEYRSPEAWSFDWHRALHGMEVYEAQPSDDVFALGVSAWRLVTGTYPPEVEVREQARGRGKLEVPPLPPLRQLNPRVEESLSVLLPRALVERAEERPTAGELAQALEETGNQKTLELDRQLSMPEPVPSQAPETRQAPRSKRAVLPGWTGYAACTVLGCLLTAAGVAGWLLLADKARALLGGGIPTGLADTRISAAGGRQDMASEESRLGEPIPEDPLQGQRRAADCQPVIGIIINGGCWVEAPKAKPPCPNGAYEWKGGCYIPFYLPPRKPTSETSP